MKLAGRRIVTGRAEGPILASPQPLSLLGGVDPTTGEVRDPQSPIRGERLAGRVLAIPQAKGSTVGSYVLYSLRKRGVAPAAIVAERAETILAVGAVIAEVPMVDQLSVDLLRTGDRALVDAEAGTIELPDVVERPVVTALLERGGRVLVVRRSARVGTFPGKWSGISGYLEGAEEPEARARQEVEEETGLRDLMLVARGAPVCTREGETVFAIHPFRFQAPHGEIRLDWENVEFLWIPPHELATLDAVPKLMEAYRATVVGATPQ